MDTTAAAAQAKVTVDTIRTWCRTGVIAATKTAGRWIINAASLARRIRLSPRKATTVDMPWPTDHPDRELLTEAADAGVTVQDLYDAVGERAITSGTRAFSRRDEDRVRGLIETRQRRTALLDELAHLCGCLGHDATKKRAAADAKLTDRELADMVSKTRAYAKAQAIDIRTQAEKDRAAGKGPATDRQINYLADLLNARRRSGEEGGFAPIGVYYRADGRVNMDKLRSLTSAHASELISSLLEH